MYSENDYDDYYQAYEPQIGGSLAYKASYYRQKGAGLGGVFGAIASRLLPFVKSLLPHVVPPIKSAVKNIAMDVINNKQSFKDSLRSNAMSALKEAGTNLLNQSGGRIRRRRRVRKRQARTRKPTKRKIKRKPKRKPLKRLKSKSKTKKKKKKSSRRKLISKPSLFD